MIDVHQDRRDREAAFWDENIPPVAECVAEYQAGSDPNSQLVLDAVEPLAGRRVLDFACGVGVLSAWLNDRGARVTGLDISPGSTARAQQFCSEVGADVKFVTGDMQALSDHEEFDVIVGRYALHHVDCTVVAPLLAARLRQGGTAAFVETLDLNPVLRFARRHVVGRFGIPRYGTLDERPLGRFDLELLERAFGDLRLEVAEMRFLRIVDRQVLHYRSKRASRMLGAVDDFLLARARLAKWSYHQVLVLRKTDEDRSSRDAC